MNSVILSSFGRELEKFAAGLSRPEQRSIASVGKKSPFGGGRITPTTAPGPNSSWPANLTESRSLVGKAKKMRALDNHLEGRRLSYELARGNPKAVKAKALLTSGSKFKRVAGQVAMRAMK